MFLATVLLVILAEPMIRLLFERGRFDIYSTARASLALVYLAPGLLAFSMVNILARAFYALGDTTTPMKVSVFCLALNAVLTFMLIFPLRQGGLGVANSMCNWTSRNSSFVKISPPFSVPFGGTTKLPF